MKKIGVIIFTLTIGLSASFSSHAGGGFYGHSYGGSHRTHGNRWVAPLVIGGIVGTAVYSNYASSQNVYREPVYVQPPNYVPYYAITPVQPKAYYCLDYGAYYPQVTTCPSPWQLVN